MARPRSQVRRSLLACAVLPLLVTACAEESSTGGDTSEDGRLEVTIGWANDLTGPLSAYGIEETNAAQLAVDQLNAAGGPVEVSLVVEDSQSTPEGVVAATQRLLGNDDVDVISGYAFTQQGQAAEPLIAQDGRPVVFASVTSVENANGNVFSMDRPNGPLQDTLVQDYLVPEGVERLAVIWQEQPTLKDNHDHLLEAAEAAGIEIVADRGTALATTDFNPQISAVLAADPDAVALDVLTQAAGTIASELRGRGYDGLLVSHLGVASELLVDVGADAVEGLVLPTFWVPTVSNEVSAAFVADYAEAYPDAPVPQLFGMLGFDAVQVIHDAVEAAESTATDDVAGALRDTTFETGMNPDLTFEDTGYAKLLPILVRYEGGEPVPVG